MGAEPLSGKPSIRRDTTFGDHDRRWESAELNRLRDENDELRGVLSAAESEMAGIIHELLELVGACEKAHDAFAAAQREGEDG